MHCAACEHDNPEDARFCNRCGAALSGGCPRCAQPNPPEARFCNACGEALIAGADANVADNAEAAAGRDPRSYTPRHLVERILNQKSSLEGERKHVTVLFADLADSTELAERIDPEEMHSLLDRAFQKILAQVHRYEGTVNQFKGDGVMALFGAPIALEDAPRRAVLAALAIHRELAGLDREVNERFGRGFRMRIGINTGPVVVGRIGDDLRMDYTAVGDTTNLASRLEQMAEPGSVLVSDITRRIIEGFFDLRALPPTRVKGKSAPVLAHEVMAEGSASSRIDTLTESELTSFVGRKVELDSLLTAMASVRQGRGQVAFVVGEAGIGKSRLLHELRSALQDTPHAWWEGRCASYAKTTPFQAIVDGVRRNLGDSALRGEFRGLADRLASDPLGSYR